MLVLPLDALKSNEYFDLPMTEFWAGANSDNLLDYQPANKPATSMPASSALAFGKQIIGSEAYTGNAHYSETPRRFKALWRCCFLRRCQSNDSAQLCTPAI